MFNKSQREFAFPSKMALPFNCPIYSRVQITLDSNILIIHYLLLWAISFERPKIYSFFFIPTLDQIFPAVISNLFSLCSFSPLTLLTMSSAPYRSYNRQVFLYLLNNLRLISLTYHTCLTWKAPGDSPNISEFFPT